MESIYRYLATPSPCGYLPDRDWRLEYELVADLTPGEYLTRMRQGWRRFGFTMFRPQCPACRACQSLRVPTASFRPNRSQRRAQKLNDGVVRLTIGPPTVSRSRMQLYDRYHAYQSLSKGWPVHPAKDVESYRSSFVDNPFATEEWCYWLDRQLVGVGYVDVLPQGMSAIYYFYEPAQRRRCLGTWNVLSIISEARRRGLPHVYLGYYVAGCESLEYKANFKPNETLGPDGVWREQRTQR
jgi:arginyl-tRNA--protein-N-Asp/Glu arginylyltransferase